MREVVLIVNPIATNVTEERVASVERELARAASVTTLYTERKRHAIELARDAAPTAAVVSFSGDGGFNEILNGINGDVPVGFVPGGGTSVLPRALGLPRDPERAARRIANALERERARRISLGRVNGRRFGFSAGIGIDAEAVRRIDERRDRHGERPGDFTFAWQVVRALVAHRGRYEPLIRIDGHGDAALLFVANGRPYTYAGVIPLPIVPHADFAHGLAFVAPRAVRPALLPWLLPTILLGRARPSRRLLAGADVDGLSVTCTRPLPMQADGEDLGDVDNVAFESERDAVAVLL